MPDLSVIRVALHWWLIGSYRTGEFIVYTGISLVQMLVDAVRSFNSFSILLYEGSILWLADMHEYLCAIQEFVINNSVYLLEIASNMLAVTRRVAYTPFSILAGILASINELLRLLGSSCLFLLSLPPLFLFYFIDTVLNAFKMFSSVTRHVGRRLTEYTADIQTLEILVGLVVGCGLVVVTVNVMKFLVKFYLKFKTAFLNAVKTAWRRAKSCVTNTRRRWRENDCKSQDTELCIICFGKTRSVCLLPCRHLCLCATCTESLPYPLRCPLCRQRAEDLIHVYL